MTIKNIENAIVDRAWAEGWIQPKVPSHRTGKSGHRGKWFFRLLQLTINQAGHHVTVFERADRVGGLLQYGIPNMKLSKEAVQRRVDKMTAEGIEFITNANVGGNVDPKQLQEEHDAILLACGATKPRDLPIENRDAKGIHFAMDFLTANTKQMVHGYTISEQFISAEGKDVIVIGGGDTGTDCIATSLRHGCRSLVNFELLPKPPEERAQDNRGQSGLGFSGVDYGHEESSAKYGRDPREFQVLSKGFMVDEAET